MRRVAAALLLSALLAGCATMNARSDAPCGLTIDADPTEMRIGDTTTITATYHNCTDATIRWDDPGCGFAPRLNGTHDAAGAALLRTCAAAIVPYELRPGRELEASATWNGTFEETGRTWTDPDGTTHTDVMGTSWRRAEPGTYTFVIHAGDARATTAVLLR